MTGPARGCPRCCDTGWVWLSAEGPGGTTRSAEASCPACCAPSPQAIRDWREAHHWSAQARPCRHCGAPTHLRDADGAPAHKVCAATAAALDAVTGGVA